MNVRLESARSESRTAICEHEGITAVYIMVADESGKDALVRETKELIPGRVMADYNRNGTLIGLEILG